MTKETEEKSKEKDDEQLVIVTDDAGAVELSNEVSEEKEGKDPPPPSKGKEKDGAEDTSDDDEDGESDERLGASEHDDNRDDRSDARAQRKSRKQRQREARARQERELNFLRQRNEQVERQLSQLAKRQESNELTMLNQRIAQIEANLKRADDEILLAKKERRAEDEVEALKIKDQLKDYHAKLKAAREQYIRRSEPAQPQVDPEVVRRAQAWHAEHSWFRFDRSDSDSKIAGAIDDALYAEGFDPRTDEYWQEFNRRIAKHLPHRAAKKVRKNDDFEDEDDEDDDEDDREERRRERRPGRSNGNGRDRDEDDRRANKSGGGPRFRVGGRDRSLKPNEVYLSAERIAAMKELGVWDDVELRNRYLKQYAEYDKAAASGQ